MKYNKILILALASFGLLSSCQDAYDIRQTGEVNDPNKVYNTIDDFERGVNSVYQTFSPDKTIEFTSIFTDEVAIGVNNGGQGVGDGQYLFQITSGTDAAASIWQANYTLINFANRIIAAKDRVKANIVADYTNLDGVLDEEDPDYLADIARFENALGQLYAIRAFSHFQLTSWFSEDAANPEALSAMKLDFVPDYNYQTYLPRIKNSEMYTFIESDLTTADAYFVSSSAAFDATRAGRNFVKAVRARMALYRKDYTTAAQLSHELIGNYNTTTISNSAASYFEMINDRSANESIFRITRVYGDSRIGAYWNSQSSAISGSPFFEVSRGLFNSYTTTSDIRNAYSATTGVGNLIDPTSKVSPNPDADTDYVNNDVLVVNKYPGNSAQGDNLLNDIKVFGYGEMFLIRAEALANLGALNGYSTSNTNKTTAQDVMRSLRRRRFANTAYTMPNYADAKEALTDIQLERRRELAFMGHRYLDIKRLGPVTGQSINRYYRDCEPYTACNLEATSYKFTMPIPTTELTANPQIRSQQNTGY